VARFDVSRSAFRVLLGRDLVFARGLTKLRLLEVTLEKRNTPPATCARASALADLTRPLRAIESNVIQHLALRNVETVADFIIDIHGSRHSFQAPLSLTVRPLFVRLDWKPRIAKRARMGMTGARIRVSVQ